MNQFIAMTMRMVFLLGSGISGATPFLQQSYVESRANSGILHRWQDQCVNSRAERAPWQCWELSRLRRNAAKLNHSRQSWIADTKATHFHLARLCERRLQQDLDRREVSAALVWVREGEPCRLQLRELQRGFGYQNSGVLASPED